MIRLHHAAQSRSMRSLWLLYELGLDFELKTYPFGAALQAPAYRALNEAGRVPTLEIDGQVIRESGAIAQVLCARAPEVGLGRTPDQADWAAWLDWIHFAETISVHAASLTQQHIILFEDHMRSPVIMKIEAKRLARTYQTIERALTDRDYLLDSGFSAADIGVGQAIYMGRHFATLEGCPHVQEWYDRITARPAFQKALPDAGEGLYAKPFYAPWSEATPATSDKS